MARESTIPACVVREDISAVEEYPGAKFIRVSVGNVDAAGEFIVPQQFKTYELKGEDFTEIMSAKPAWAPNKPAGTYRNDDLWRFIDQQRGAMV